jgi:FkbM family methyltransferase
MEFKRIDLKEVRPSQAHLPIFKSVMDDNKIIESDFYFLKAYKGKKVFIIDIGANIGAFSLAALNLVGNVTSIGFEPNISLEWFLQQTRSAYAAAGQEFCFNLVGLSDLESSIDLYIPRIEDWHVIGEASMDRSQFERENVIKRLKGYSSKGAFDLDIATVQVRIFDSLAIEPPADTEVVIVKIDVENYEPHVLRGMKKFLEKYKPIVFAENSNPESVNILAGHGYSLFEYDVQREVLAPTTGAGRDNIIYLHADRLDGFGVIAITHPASEAMTPIESGLSGKSQPSACKADGAQVHFECPNCLASNHRIMLPASEERPALVQCSNCEAEMFWPLPSPGELAEYYSRDNFLGVQGREAAESYKSDPLPTRRGVETLAQHLRANGVPANGVVVELGCSYGTKVIELRRAGFDAWGVERCEEAVAWLNANGGRGYCGDILDQDFPLRKIDAVYSSHELQHLINPYAVLRKIGELMPSAGYISLALPHWGGLVAQHQLERWKWFNYPRHLHYFCARAMPQLLSTLGFQTTGVSTTYGEQEAAEALDAFKVPAASAIDASSKAALSAILANGRLGEQLFVNAQKKC